MIITNIDTDLQFPKKNTKHLDSLKVNYDLHTIDTEDRLDGWKFWGISINITSKILDVTRRVHLQ